MKVISLNDLNEYHYIGSQVVESSTIKFVEELNFDLVAILETCDKYIEWRIFGFFHVINLSLRGVL